MEERLKLGCSESTNGHLMVAAFSIINFPIQILFYFFNDKPSQNKSKGSWKGAERRKSGAYSLYASILNRLQPRQGRLDLFKDDFYTEFYMYFGV
jgi:hypothetical protein